MEHLSDAILMALLIAAALLLRFVVPFFRR